MAGEVRVYRGKLTKPGEVLNATGAAVTTSQDPPAFVTVVLANPAKAAEVDEYMVDFRGFALHEVDPPADIGQPMAAVQIRNAVLDDDWPTNIAVLGGDAWTDIVTKTLNTKGGTIAMVTLSGIAATVIGGQLRCVIDGGAFSNAEVGPELAQFPILSAGCAGFTFPLSVPATESRVSYTIKLHMRAFGIAATIKPLKGTALTIVEYAAYAA